MHLNGRVYDPLIARMTSADPMVPAPMTPTRMVLDMCEISYVVIDERR